MKARRIPDPSLCDTCCYSYFLSGGRVGRYGLGDDPGYDCPQRYCSEFPIAIHFGGKQECDKYKEKGEMDNG